MTKTRSLEPSRAPRSAPSLLSPLQRFAQFTAMAVAAVALASCAVLPTNRYPQKSDAKPHEGVASAQSYAIHGIDVSKWQGTIDWTAVRNAARNSPSSRPPRRRPPGRALLRELERRRRGRHSAERLPLRLLVPPGPRAGGMVQAPHPG
jgi:hypothetical protein